MRVIYRKIRHARYLYIKRNVEKVWGARYTLGAHYLSKNTVVCSKPLQLTCKKLLVYHQVPSRVSLAWQCMSTLAGDSDKAVSGCEHASIYDHPALKLVPLLLLSVAG